MRDDALAGVLLFFGLIFLLFGLVVLAGWAKTRAIVKTGSPASARVVAQEIRPVNESLGPPAYLVRAVDHLYIQLEFPGPGGDDIAFWHDVGPARGAQAAGSYQVRYRTADPRQCRVAGTGDWDRLGGGSLLCLLGVTSVLVVVWHLISGASF